MDIHPVFEWQWALDPTYGRGGFYKHGIPMPAVASDRELVEGINARIDYTGLPIKDESVQSVVFDPPFIIKDNSSRMRMIKFGSFINPDDRQLSYLLATMEMYRILRPGGILVFKCQDDTFNHKFMPVHIQVYNVAISAGFRPEDLFVLVTNSRPRSWNTVHQEHARKFHSYFWVFKKVTRSARLWPTTGW